MCVKALAWQEWWHDWKLGVGVKVKGQLLLQPAGRGNKKGKTQSRDPHLHNQNDLRSLPRWVSFIPTRLQSVEEKQLQIADGSRKKATQNKKCGVDQYRYTLYSCTYIVNSVYKY